MSKEMQILIGLLDNWEMEIIAADYMTPEDHIRVRMIHGFRNKIDEAIKQARAEEARGKNDI